MIQISKQACISEQGKRANNEDKALFSEGKVFVVCDGVGGNEKGEVASQIVAEVFLECGLDGQVPDLNLVLKKAEARIDEHLAQHPETFGMATTLTYSLPTEEGILIAWCGDSRVYQFREGRIIFQTRDHSWVNEAVENGIITPEEAINHPKSNIITRAIQGSHKPAQLDCTLLHDVRKGDFFLHCSDGVLEAWSNTDLEALFNTNVDVDALASVLKQQCEIDSRDNFTAIIYAIESTEFQPDSMITVQPLNEQEYVAAIAIDKLPDEDDKTNQSFKKSKDSKGDNWKGYGIAIIIPLLFYGIYSFFKVEKLENTFDNKKHEQPTDKKGDTGKGKVKDTAKFTYQQKNEAPKDSIEKNP